MRNAGNDDAAEARHTRIFCHGANSVQWVSCHRNSVIRAPKVVEIVSWAASNGDRSENADYLYGKKRLREIDRRIRYLTKRLESAVLVDPLQLERDRFKLNRAQCSKSGRVSP